MDCCLRLGWEKSDKHGGWTTFKISRVTKMGFFFQEPTLNSMKQTAKWDWVDRGHRGHRRQTAVTTKQVNPRWKYQFGTDTYVWRKWFCVSTGTWHIKYSTLHQPLRKWEGWKLRFHFDADIHALYLAISRGRLCRDATKGCNGYTRGLNVPNLDGLLIIDAWKHRARKYVGAELLIEN
jgi:hypothetical protein